MEENILIRGVFNRWSPGNVIMLCSGIVVFLTDLVLPMNLGSDIDSSRIMWSLFLGIAPIGCSLFDRFNLRSCEITVTDKRIYGETTMSRKINFPIETILSVEMCSNNGFFIITNSEKVKFVYCENCIEVYNVISQLISQRHSEEVSDN
ncbi:MAG: hypothetical protein J5766_00025 [Clostridia bacterium]|nr:hypothetical protein [Clostridia bacterium]